MTVSWRHIIFSLRSECSFCLTPPETNIPLSTFICAAGNCMCIMYNEIRQDRQLSPFCVTNRTFAVLHTVHCHSQKIPSIVSDVAYVVSCFVLRYPFRQNQLTTDVYSVISGSHFRLVYIKPAFSAQNTSKHTVIISMHIYWWSMRWQKPVTI